MSQSIGSGRGSRQPTGGQFSTTPRTQHQDECLCPRSDLELSEEIVDVRQGNPAGSDYDTGEIVLAAIRLGIVACEAFEQTAEGSRRELFACLLGALHVAHRVSEAEQGIARGRFLELLGQTPESPATAALARAWEEGRALSPAKAAGVATGAILSCIHIHAAGARTSTGTRLLTPREREVFALLALGMSDREIAERLMISQHTASTHVKNVRDKLGGGHRAAAVARAFFGLNSSVQPQDA